MKSKESLERRLAAYGKLSLSLAALAVPASAHAASISLVTGGGTAATATPSQSLFFDPVSLNFNTSGLISGYELQTVYADPMATLSSRLSGIGADTIAMQSSSIQNLQSKDPVGASLSFGNNFSTLAYNIASPPGQFNPTTTNGKTGFVGLRMPNGADAYYGWANITVNPDYSVTLNSFGSETSANTSVAAGDVTAGDVAAVPEPASILLLAMGAAGIAAYKRKLTQG